MPADAIVGDAIESDKGVGRSVVTIVGSRGNFCSGTMIGTDLVLTAAHCIPPGATYKVVAFDTERQPVLLDIERTATHPKFNASSIASHRATADVALLQLAEPIANRPPAVIGVPNEPFQVGSSYTIAGVGVAKRGDGRTGGVIREATLESTSRPGRLQIRLLDPETENETEGRGACTGDSGGPVFEEQKDRPVIIGVMSWSTGPKNSSGCGGLTGVTPLSLYRDWILDTAAEWDTKARQPVASPTNPLSIPNPLNIPNPLKLPNPLGLTLSR